MALSKSQVKLLPTLTLVVIIQPHLAKVRPDQGLGSGGEYE